MKVLLVTQSTSHAAYTNTASALTAQGHTVVGMLDSALTTPPADTDVIATVRATPANFASWLSARWAEGFPILIGGAENGSADGATTHAAQTLGILQSPYTTPHGRTNQDRVYVETSGLNHPIVGTKTGEQIVSVAQNWVVRDLGTPKGTTIANFGISSGIASGGAIVAVEQGDTLYSGTAPARAAFLGFFYGGQANYTIAGQQIISNTVDWVGESVVSLDDGYNAEVMTASATVVEPTHVGAPPNVTINALPMTASASMPGGTGGGNAEVVAVAADTYITAESPSMNFNSATDLRLDQGNFQTKRAFFKFAKTPRAPQGAEYITKAVLRVYVTTYGGSGLSTLTMSRLTQDWNPATINAQAAPPSGVESSVSAPIPFGSAGTWVEVDVTAALNAWLSGATNHGISLWTTSTSQLEIASSESANKPQLVVGYEAPASVEGVADPMAASATMPEASVSTSQGASIGSTPMTADAIFLDATAAVEQFVDVSVEAEIMDAYATWPTTTGFALVVNNYAEPFLADAEVLGGTEVATERGTLLATEPMRANAVWKQPDSVNGQPIILSESEDKYFQRVMESVPAAWFRLNDRGSTATNRMDPSRYKGVFTGGAFTGQFNGPDGRHSVYFDGTGMLAKSSGGGLPHQPDGDAETTLEFSIRTTKKNQFILVSADAMLGIAADSQQPPTEVYLQDGKIRLVRHRRVGTTMSVIADFTGFTDLADGEWHHIVLRTVTGDHDFYNGVAFFVDGKLEIRRRAEFAAPGLPDYIGSRPASVEGFQIGALPSSMNFVGDMSEVVAYGHGLNEQVIPKHYYAFMGWTPIDAGSMDAFAFMPADNSGRGNQKRALYLDWGYEEDAYNYGGGTNNNRPNHNPIVGAPAEAAKQGGSFDYEGFRVFVKPVQSVNYRDPVTDEQTLIDLDVHVNIDEYDLIMFRDWPDESREENNIRALPGGMAQKERLIQQLRDANDKGIGLLVTHPRMAADLGIVDRVEWVQNYKESFGSIFVSPGNPNNTQGNAVGLYDYGSAVKFPWDIVESAGLEANATRVGGLGTGLPMNTDPAFLDRKAYFYEDHNHNNRQRVRAVVEGLTDIGAYTIKDAIFHIDKDLWGDTVPALNLDDRMDGLRIGDEFIIHGSNPAQIEWDDAWLRSLRIGRPYGYYAAPVSAVKSGTIVTTFGAKMWMRKEEVDNPYKDYATTIILKPGDTLAGRPVGGRIFVNFTEKPGEFLNALPVNVLPGSKWDVDGTAVWPNRYLPDTEAQRDWEFSGTRVSVSTEAIGSSNPIVNITMPDGSQVQVRAGDASSNRLFMVNYSNLFELEWVPYLTMVQRGWYWLSYGDKVQEGDKVVAAQPMTANAVMPEAAVVAQKDAGYTAQPMAALAQMTRVAESTVGDVEVRDLPMTAHAEFTGFGKTISADPMLAHAELVDSFNMVHATGEQVVLTLHGVDATLYLKEEA